MVGRDVIQGKARLSWHHLWESSFLRDVTYGKAGLDMTSVMGKRGRARLTFMGKLGWALRHL